MHFVYADGGIAQDKETHRPSAYWTVKLCSGLNCQILCAKSGILEVGKSMEAELSSILDAFEEILRLPLDTVTLFSDCIRAVEKLNERSPFSRSRLHQLQMRIWEIWDELMRRGRSVRLQWVPREVIERQLGH